MRSARTDRMRESETSKPAKPKPVAKKRRKPDSGSDTRTRHIPRAVRDEVFIRDGGRCSWIGNDGKRCDSPWDLEIDHIIPYAKGGGNSPDNLRLLCARHNRLAAEWEFGKERMEKYHRRE
jgi:5-methylcytosine-specific restriction endonuclease McrA